MKSECEQSRAIRSGRRLQGGVQMRGARVLGGVRGVMGWFLVACLVSSMLPAARLSAQVKINEVLANNEATPPLDIGAGTPDILELRNTSSTETVTLGTATQLSSWLLTDTAELPADIDLAYKFPAGRATIPPDGRLVIFCDGNAAEDTCELHASFSINNDGTEPISLWGPARSADPFDRELMDQVWLPPLQEDVCFKRCPDGAGPAPMPIAETLDWFRFGDCTFGSCVEIPGICILGTRRFCPGEPNSCGPQNVAPRVTRIEQSTNAPAADEPVSILARVRDDRTPTPENIDRVELVYRVLTAGTAGTEQTVEMTFISTGGPGDDGVLSGADRSPPVPLDFFTHWEGEIPGQVAGTRVEFFLRVTDKADDGVEALSATRPTTLCEDDIGPCDRQFGNPDGSDDCPRDLLDRRTCPDPADPEGSEIDFVGERFISCSARWSYAVGYQVDASLSGLVINEVVPLQTDLYIDRTENPCTIANMCPEDNPTCCQSNEDFIELYNSGDAAIDLSGCWLSDAYFSPRAWQFPAGSVLMPESYGIVWLDNDGGQCPEPARVDKPCWWECPDPNVASMQFGDNIEWHANFQLNADGDQIFLFDREEMDFGLICGIDFSEPSEFPGFTENRSVPDGMGGMVMTNPGLQVLANQSIARVPNGTKAGQLVITERGSPRMANPDLEPSDGFKRGDTNCNGGVDLSDGIFLLNFLFSGGPTPCCLDGADSNDSGGLDLSDGIAIFLFLFSGGDEPPAPGPFECGPDATDDDALTECDYEAC